MTSDDFRIIPSPRRKRVAFRIGDDGMPEILVPPRFDTAHIHRIFRENFTVIEKLKQRVIRRQTPSFTEGAEFMFLGKMYPLHLTHRLKIFDNSFMVPDGNADEIKSSLISLYRELAAVVIKKRLTAMVNKTGLSPQKVRISSATTNWGSCSGKKTVSFAWQLVQCPPELIDYVIIHELSHLKELNHSPAFWKTVAEFIPDYRIKRGQLKKISFQLPRWY